jgi:hypothetical protein
VAHGSGYAEKEAEMSHSTRSFLVLLVMGVAAVPGFVLTAPDAPAQASKTPDELLKGFLAAVQAHSYDDMVAPIVAEGGQIAAELEKPEQKAAILLALDKLSQALGPRLAKGYSAISLGMLKYRGHQVHLWKLEYKDGGDDDLAYGIVTADGRFRNFGVRPPGFVQGTY